MVEAFTCEVAFTGATTLKPMLPKNVVIRSANPATCVPFATLTVMFA